MGVSILADVRLGQPSETEVSAVLTANFSWYTD